MLRRDARPVKPRNVTDRVHTVREADGMTGRPRWNGRLVASARGFVYISPRGDEDLDSIL